MFLLEVFAKYVIIFLQCALF